MKFQKGSDIELTYPMTAVPTAPSNIVSPCPGVQHGVAAPTAFGTPEFQEMLDEVMAVRKDVESNIFPAWFFEKYGIDPKVPQLLRKYGLFQERPATLAAAVHMDDPMDLGKALRMYAQNFDIPLKSQTAHSGKHFLDRIVDVLPPLAQNISNALKKVFEVKYFYGQPRPEEVKDIPGAVATHYPEGCPAHPAYPAGHGAAAGATNKWFRETYDATAEQLLEVETATKHWAMYRTLAGVHYSQDNLAGWELGNQ